MKELEESIKCLKRKKGLGPDNIPNEIFIEADNDTKQLYHTLTDDIRQREEIPQQWLIREIIRLYKGRK